ncbi:serine hydrolase domain-containing protein [Mycobacterium sp. OTB74]|uniref:serine hydrolase domain-containing protein n=1 Tax=Mycobacterium sp. OTB74 TaxID=1853452 RepID=UPI0024771C50|nr:serine hydrolase domain-containing protein [Mycobacterium sp. OTB74]
MNLDANTESVTAAIDAGLLAGAVTLVWQDGQVLQVNELGHRDVEAGLPMQRDTVFRIASMSKPVTIAAAMTLVDEEKLALTDPIAQWVPELANPRVMTSLTGPLDRTVALRRPITIDDLMTHRSGLAYGFSVPAPLGTAYTKLQTLQDPDRWLAALGELPLAHQPGEQLTYSQSTDVLGFILARIEGKPLSDVLAERIFEPLGMVDTGFSVTTSGRRRAATMYRLVPGDNDDVTLQHGVMGPPQVVPPKFCAGGGGLWSTADDYLRFARMLLGNGEVDRVRVLSEESAQLMRTDQLTAEQKSQDFLGAPFWIGRGFGLNLSVVTDSTKSAPFYGPGGVGTFSWPGAFGTWWQADPQANLILIYLIQNAPELNVDAAAAVAGNTSLIKLRSAQPKFVRRTYKGLGF